MADQFREVEAAFGRLKEKFGGGRISQQEFIDSLKQLRIKDDEGRFWMIGAQSGNWYFFNNSLISDSTSPIISGSSTASHLFKNTTKEGNPTCLAKRICSLV